MKKDKSKKSFLLWGFGILLLFFSALSLLHIRTSFFLYKTTKEKMKEVQREKEDIKKNIEKARKQGYRSKNTGFTNEEDLNKINIIDAPSPSEKNKPFSKKEVRIDIIEQEQTQ